MMPKVPTKHAVVKIHRNRRSSTMATYFQSSIIWKEESNKGSKVSSSIVCKSMESKLIPS